MTNIFEHLNIILASQSPRRQQLLAALGIKFTSIVRDIDESFDERLHAEEIPLYLCKKKANAMHDLLKDNNTLVITADTVVWVNNHVLNKPVDIEDAKKMLTELSGNMHRVYTGVHLLTQHKSKSFYCESKVYFKHLSKDEIEYYVNTYKPLDKAGAYGIQEWIGYIGIEKIEGSFYNIMGLPVKELYEELLGFV